MVHDKCRWGVDVFDDLPAGNVKNRAEPWARGSFQKRGERGVEPGVVADGGGEQLLATRALRGWQAGGESLQQPVDAARIAQPTRFEFHGK
jgi:hypothetical protein